MFDPTLNLPYDTLIEFVQFPTRISNALRYAGFKTVGEVRETSDSNLLSLQDIGYGSLDFLRKTLGTSSTAPTEKSADGKPALPDNDPR